MSDHTNMFKRLFRCVRSSICAAYGVALGFLLLSGLPSSTAQAATSESNNGHKPHYAMQRYWVDYSVREDGSYEYSLERTVRILTPIGVKKAGE